jgi:hypothetical protein
MDAKALIKQLEKQGYQVKKVVETTKKTFDVPTEQLAKFNEVVKRRDMKIKDAMIEMFDMWIGKWGER